MAPHPDQNQAAIPTPDNQDDQEEPAMLDPDEAGEEVTQDEDAAMDSGDGDDEDAAHNEQIELQNDSIAHFDAHKDSIFCIAQHPTNAVIIATGGGDDTGYVFSRRPADGQVTSNGAADGQPQERDSLKPISKLSGHTDSINAITFTQPSGDYLVTGGLDGQLRVYQQSTTTSSNTPTYTFLTSAREVDEINFLISCPSSSHPNTIALGASDGSIWLYSISAPSDPRDPTTALTILNAFYLHTAPATAGAFTPKTGTLLATVAEDSSLYVWDAFGDAAAAGITSSSGGGQAVVGLTGEDERFRVDGGLYSVAVSPNETFIAVGGAEGHIRVVGLPRLGVSAPQGVNAGVKSGAGSKAKTGGGKQNPSKSTDAGSASGGQAGQILVSLSLQSESVETIAFGGSLMAAGSVDGSFALFDTTRNFALRKHIVEAVEEGQAVIKLEFSATKPNLLTSCGNDGVVRVWDTIGAIERPLKEFKGHRGGGEGGGVLGFVQGGESYIVTAGDDGVALVFDTTT